MSMRVFFLGIWPLFMGLFFIMAGNSVQGALVAYRLGLLYENNLLSGIVLSGYSIGMLIAVSTMPYFIKSVGHVRVFAAMAATVSAALLIFPLLVNPAVWFALRLAIGFCYVGLYVVAEAWINALATNEYRGRMMSFYMITQMLGFLAGQFTLRFTTPESATLFLVGSVAISLAAVPMLMIKINVPMKSDYSKRMPVRQLYRLSPFALLGTILIALQFVPFYTALGLFAQKAHLDLKQLSTLSVLVLLAGTAAQWPLARLSDRIDRRLVIMFSSIGAACIAFLGIFGNIENIYFVYSIIFLVALCVLPLYPINLSHANDVIPREQIVAAGSTIQMMNATGTMIGPILLGYFVDHFDASGFFSYIVCVSIALVLYTFYRTKSRQITSHRRAIMASFLQLRGGFRDLDVQPREMRKSWDITTEAPPTESRSLTGFSHWLDKGVKKLYQRRKSPVTSQTQEDENDKAVQAKKSGKKNVTDKDSPTPSTAADTSGEDSSS